MAPTALVWPRCPVPVPLPQSLLQHDSSRSTILALCTNLPVVAEGPVLAPLQQQLLLPLLSLTWFGLWHNGGLQHHEKSPLTARPIAWCGAPGELPLEGRSSVHGLSFLPALGLSRGDQHCWDMLEMTACPQVNRDAEITWLSLSYPVSLCNRAENAFFTCIFCLRMGGSISKLAIWSYLCAKLKNISQLGVLKHINI